MYETISDAFSEVVLRWKPRLLRHTVMAFGMKIVAVKGGDETQLPRADAPKSK